MRQLPVVGKRNQVAGIVISVMVEIDAMETERLSERILSGLDQAHRDEKRLGRPPGSVKDRIGEPAQKLLKEYPGVVKDVKAGLSIRQIAAIREVSKDTVQRVKKALKNLVPVD